MVFRLPCQSVVGGESYAALSTLATASRPEEPVLGPNLVCCILRKPSSDGCPSEWCQIGLLAEDVRARARGCRDKTTISTRGPGGPTPTTTGRGCTATRARGGTTRDSMGQVAGEEAIAGKTQPFPYPLGHCN